MLSLDTPPRGSSGPIPIALLIAGVVTPLLLLSLARAQAPGSGPAGPVSSGSDPTGQGSPDTQSPDSVCTVDLTSAGQMADIVSNALNRGLDQDSTEVRDFLRGAHEKFATGEALLEAAAKHFGIATSDLAAQVERYRHCNCTHVGGEKFGQTPATGTTSGEFEMTGFAGDVMLHVVLHEMGHALIREFDLPVLGNEETVADAFATHFLTAHLPGRALDVLSARTRSLMIEAREVPRAEWTVRGEHNSDARRAFQIAALAVAADPERYRAVALDVGMTDREIQRAVDYGAEIHRSWRRTLAPLWMPAGMASKEARLVFGADDGFAGQVRSSELAGVLDEALRRFDWHSQVKIRFVNGKGGAGWSRSARTITVHSEYVSRFVRQGRSETDGDPEEGTDRGR